MQKSLAILLVISALMCTFVATYPQTNGTHPCGPPPNGGPRPGGPTPSGPPSPQGRGGPCGPPGQRPSPTPAASS